MRLSYDTLIETLNHVCTVAIITWVYLTERNTQGSREDRWQGWGKEFLIWQVTRKLRCGRWQVTCSKRQCLWWEATGKTAIKNNMTGLCLRSSLGDLRSGQEQKPRVGKQQARGLAGNGDQGLLGRQGLHRKMWGEGSLCASFGTQSHCVAQTGLEFKSLMAQFPKFWDYGCVCHTWLRKIFF
jgi:hypothetical protein